MKMLTGFTFLFLLVTFVDPTNPVGIRNSRNTQQDTADISEEQYADEEAPKDYAEKTMEDTNETDDERPRDFAENRSGNDPNEDEIIDDIPTEEEQEFTDLDGPEFSSHTDVEKMSPKPWRSRRFRFRAPRFRRITRGFRRALRRVVRGVTRAVRRAVRRVSRIVRRTVRNIRRSIKRFTRFRVKRIGKSLKKLVSKVISKIKPGKPETEPNPPPGETCGEACQLRKQLLRHIKFFSQASCSFTAVQKLHSNFFLFRTTDTTLQIRVGQFASAAKQVYDQMAKSLKKLDPTYTPLTHTQIFRKCLPPQGELLPCSGGQGIITVFKTLKCHTPCPHYDAAPCAVSDGKLLTAIKAAEKALEDELTRIGG